MQVVRHGKEILQVFLRHQRLSQSSVVKIKTRDVRVFGKQICPTDASHLPSLFCLLEMDFPELSDEFLYLVKLQKHASSYAN